MYTIIYTYIFTHTIHHGFTIHSVKENIQDKRISKKTIETAIKNLQKKRLLAYNSKNKHYYLLNNNPELLYELLNIDYTVEQTYKLTEYPTGFIYAYYYDTYKQMAYQNDVPHFPMKIGHTTRLYPLIRIQEQLSSSTPETPTVGLLVPCNQSSKLERMIHQWYKYHNRHINVSYNNEWFATNTYELIQVINQLTQKTE